MGWLALALALASIPAGGGEQLGTVPDGYELVEGSLRFSQDGKHWAYVATRNGCFHPVSGADVGEAYDEVAPPVMLPSGAPVFFRAMKRDKKSQEQWVLLRDGKKIAESGWIGPLGIGAQGVPACWVFKDRHLRGGCSLAFGKKKTKQWQTGDLDSSPGISADGRLAVTVATRDDDWVILSLDDKGEEQVHGAGWIISAIPRPDGKGILATVLSLADTGPQRGQPRHYTLARFELGEKLASSQMGDGYSSAGSPRFSPDGAYLAYKVSDEKGKMGVALDDEREAPCSFEFVDELTFSPDGTQVAFSACVKGKVVFPPTFELENTTGSEVLVGVSAEQGTWVASPAGARAPSTSTCASRPGLPTAARSPSPRCATERGAWSSTSARASRAARSRPSSGTLPASGYDSDAGRDASSSGGSSRSSERDCVQARRLVRASSPRISSTIAR